MILKKRALELIDEIQKRQHRPTSLKPLIIQLRTVVSAMKEPIIKKKPAAKKTAAKK